MREGAGVRLEQNASDQILGANPLEDRILVRYQDRLRILQRAAQCLYTISCGVRKRVADCAWVTDYLDVLTTLSCVEALMMNPVRTALHPTPSVCTTHF